MINTQQPPSYFREPDDAASVAHDYIHGLNGVTKEQADAAIWKIHEFLRPLIDPTGNAWRRP